MHLNGGNILYKTRKCEWPRLGVGVEKKAANSGRHVVGDQFSGSAVVPEAQFAKGVWWSGPKEGGVSENGRKETDFY